MSGKIRGAARLSRSDWPILVQAWVYLLGFDLALRGLSFRRVRRWADASTAKKRTPRPFAQADEDDLVRRLHRLVDIAARNHLYPMSCLRRALALQRLLTGRGVVVELRIGVRKRGFSQLDAHAWLEYRGQPIGEPESMTDEYTAILGRETACAR